MLQKHMKTVHNKRKDFACNLCGKCFTNKFSWKYHTKGRSCQDEITTQNIESNQTGFILKPQI